MSISRRTALAGLPLLLTGCADVVANARPDIDPGYERMYGAITSEPFPIRALDLSRVNPAFLRREVSYETKEPPGTIVVDTANRYAYLVGTHGRAIRYGVGVGREEAFNFQGSAIIARKAEWPRWIPTPDMIRRDPEKYGPYAGGLDGGLKNPLGPRALYLYKDGKDTYYRLHGNDDWRTIGTTVSSGCVRLHNHDIIDLYRRVPVGTKVVVLTSGTA